MKKIHVIINDVAFYTSANAIKNGVGQSQQINNLVRRIYAELIKSNASKGSTGVGFSDMDGYQVQINFI